MDLKVIGLKMMDPKESLIVVISPTTITINFPEAISKALSLRHTPMAIQFHNSPQKLYKLMKDSKLIRGLTI